MPERPKRRKNKNKRKNKNNKSEDNKATSHLATSSNSELDSNASEVIPSVITNDNEISTTKNTVQQSLDTQTIKTTKDSGNLSGDLNNNKSQTSEADYSTNFTEDFKENIKVGTPSYVVESPDQPVKVKKKLEVANKSKSLDNDDGTNIVDITEEANAQSGDESALALIDSQNVLITLVDSDVEWEKTDDLNNSIKSDTKEEATGVLSVTTIPLSTAHCDETKSLTPDEEMTLRNYLKTLNLATHPENVSSIEIKTEIEQIINQEIKHRLRKKGLADDFVVHRLGPRVLDVIDEEGSSESSIASRRQSYLSDKKSDVEDLEDDVFEDKNKIAKTNKFSSCMHKKSFGQLVPQQCMLVDAKIKEQEVTEARGDWTMKTIEKMGGAELVYLTDTSSSTSSLHEIGEEDEGVDTDVSIRMITPTIEVTDTENFLKKTFVSNPQDELHMNDIKNIKIYDNLVNTPETEIKILHKQDTSSSNDSGKEIKILPYKITEPTNKSKFDTNEHKVQTETDGNETSQKQNGSQNIIKKSHFEGNVPMEHEQIVIDEQSDYKNSSPKTHEIVVSSVDNIRTNLYVKDIDVVDTDPKNANSVKKNDIIKKHTALDLKTKVIKCEFNDAINNLIREVSSDSEVNTESKEPLTRQDSSSSMGSSQCTAKYNPDFSSLNDISNLTHDEVTINTKQSQEQISAMKSHVKDVFEYVAGATKQSNRELDDHSKQPSRLRDLCVRNIANLPFGDKILEELASVSERLQNITKFTSVSNQDIKDRNKTMPYYRLPDISSIKKVTLSSNTKEPPPLQPRHSSLKKSQDDTHDDWTGIPTKTEPIYVCLSPSQKMLMEKTNTVITKEDASQLVDMHKKYVDRRGYNETFKSNVNESTYDDHPILPFKSQTGSRLLALIRDPALTRNIHTINERLNFSHNDVKRNLSSRDSDFVFKPIPPPRPRKYSAYESDESSDFTDTSLRSIKSERKYFHYSTGNLNKEIENDISSIQNMHRFFTDTREKLNNYECPRRPSLPKDLCEQQMEYIRRKEKEVEAEIQRLENFKDNSSHDQKKGPRAPLVSEKEIINEEIKDPNNYFLSRKKEIHTTMPNEVDSRRNKLSLFSSSEEEIRREKMYSEYVTQMAQREERKQHKVIKITNPSTSNSKSMPSLDFLGSKVNNRIEKEFISKAKERWDKLGIKDPETEDERDSVNVYKEPKVIEHKIKVIESGKLKDVKNLPSHLQDFVHFTAKDTNSTSSSGESTSGPASPHLVIMCAVIIIVIAVGKYFLRLLRNK